LPSRPKHCYAGVMANNTSDPTKDARPFTMIDGYSLSLSQGTGIATYARGLAHALKSMDHRVGVLYGRPIESSAPQLLKEVALYDEEPDRDQNTASFASVWSRRIRNTLALAKNPTLTFTAEHIPLTGSVVGDQQTHRVPEGTSAYNVNQLYDIAQQQFTNLRAFTTVRVANPPDTMHWTYPMPLRMHGTRNVYTLHDLVPLRLPHLTLDNKKRYYALVKRIADTADHIITVSECSKKDIMDLLGVPEHKITNTYQTVQIPERLLKIPDEDIAAEVENLYGLEFKKFYLFYGTIEPKKNVTRLVQAYLTSGVQDPLVLVGPRAWGADETALALKIENGEYGNRVRRIKYVPFPKLVSLIRAAKATLFPSLYEGFGLPVLESMMLGTPVLSSNVSSITEVAGDAALLVNPYDIREIRDGIRAIDANADMRKALVKRGTLQMSRFNEEACARRLTRITRDKPAVQTNGAPAIDFATPDAADRSPSGAGQY
jgi:glycosyltransferase involved in cell wall biosynthesis